jgi:hypothetical protein
MPISFAPRPLFPFPLIKTAIFPELIGHASCPAAMELYDGRYVVIEGWTREGMMKLLFYIISSRYTGLDKSYGVGVLTDNN